MCPAWRRAFWAGLLPASPCQRPDDGRDTVRHAVAVLRDEGLVFTVAHRGTFVGPRPD